MKDQNRADRREKHRIAVISDTHGILRPEIMDIIKTCEVILHGGDIDKPEIISRLQAVCRTYAVRGNADKVWAEKLPKELEAELFGFRIYMVHNKKDMKKDLSGIDIVIYGHSHKYEEKREGELTFLNPGSCGPRRFHLPVTMMILTLYPDSHSFETQMIDCSPMLRQKDEMIRLPEKDMHKLIGEITKEMDAGRKIADIAARNRVDEKLVEQICRIYVTHPGVDADGILDRMER